MTKLRILVTRHLSCSWLLKLYTQYLRQTVCFTKKIIETYIAVIQDETACSVFFPALPD